MTFWRSCTCEMVTTLHLWTFIASMVPFCSQEENTEDLLAEQLSGIENSVINQSHHAVTSVPRTYSCCLLPRSLTPTKLDILDFTLR